MPRRAGLELEVVSNADLGISNPDPLQRPELGGDDSSGKAVLAG
jgi:hypothetical protein